MGLSSSSADNISFLNSIFERAFEHCLSIGVYTNKDDWDEITGGATTRNVKLWYWSARGSGTSNESPPNFDDFEPFGSWTTPSVKQFAKFEQICGIMVNRNIYSTSLASITAVATEEKNDPIVVGGIGLAGAQIGRKTRLLSCTE
ncbi:hypothetical protein COOONC_04021 [Cooperia oncophora]